MIDFDRILVRRGTDSYKWDGVEEMFGSEDVLPFWVADMDFAAPDPIIEAVRRRAGHPVFGYELRSRAIVDAVSGWLAGRHGWRVAEEWLMFCPPGTIVGMYGLVAGLTQPGDGVACLSPGYQPLFRIVEGSGRRLIRCPLAEEGGRFRLDADDLRRRIDDRARMILLCNPHNPTGRAFTEQELRGIADIAIEKNLFVVCDEVHADLVMPGHRHVPFAKLDITRSVSVISPNKTFNTAGLPQSTFVIPDAEIREVFGAFLDTLQVNHESTFGVAAAVAGYRHCAGWLDRLLLYLDDNHRMLRAYLDERMPEIRAVRAEATYLAWLDCRQSGFTEPELMRRLAEVGRVGLYAGSAFGEEGTGYLRMNIACPRESLRLGLDGIARALR